MKITKYIHSCLLVEEAGKTVLIDPGMYSVSEKAVSIDTFDSLDYIAITHEHTDHMDIAFIKQLVKKFPSIVVMSNTSVAQILEKEGLPAGRQGIIVQTKGDGFIDLKVVPHEEIFAGKAPQNVMVTVNGKLAHPGDSHHFTTLAPILALPITAPWGSTTDAVKLALKLKPQAIVPIHDWHLNEKARQTLYSWLEGFFKPHNIRFIPLETGKTTQI